MREISKPGAGGDPASADASEVATEDERWVRCAACGASLAPEKARIAIDGAHEHTFMNPAGIRFVVMCFASAPGCAPEGERSTVWTWFPGHAWQIEHCRSCGAHVGWSFHAVAGGRAFWGLVADRLA
jgi:hypothetical protein